MLPLTVLESLSSFISPELYSSASLLEVRLSFAQEQLVPSLLAQVSAGPDCNRWRCWSTGRESSLGGLLTGKWTERYFFLLIPTCDIGYLKVGKSENRNKKDKSEMGAAAKGNIRRRILWESHLFSHLPCMGKIRDHGGAGLGTVSSHPVTAVETGGGPWCEDGAVAVDRPLPIRSSPVTSRIQPPKLMCDRAIQFGG